MSGMDDPREILKAAGVDVPEVDRVLEPRMMDTAEFTTVRVYPPKEQYEDAILALTRLVAKYKWQRDECLRLGIFPHWEGVLPEDQPMDLDRRWAESQT